MPDINYLAVLVSGVVMMIIGGLWYGPLFGNMWMKGMGWDPNDSDRKDKMKKGAAPAYAQMFIGSLLMAYVFAHVLWAFGQADAAMTGAVAGLQGGFWLWVGFILPVKYGDKLWNGKQFKYVSVDLAYHLVSLLVVGMILAGWR